ncbi:hypothetical protein [Streptococcus agalactiae]|nr:hypothetical protein [Streptococcus agalactiae]
MAARKAPKIPASLANALFSSVIYLIPSSLNQLEASIWAIIW